MQQQSEAAGSARSSGPEGTLRVAWGLAAATVLLHALFGRGYGIFRDEFYYIVAGERLAWGYADFPPLVAGVAALSSRGLGDSLLALRSLPVLAGAFVVFLSAWMTREVGGGARAQLLAGGLVLGAPVMRTTSNLLSPIPFDILWWTLASAVLLRALRRGRPGLLVAVGAISGVGLLTKYNILFFGFTLVVGLVATRERRWFTTPWPWLGGALALAIAAPALVWQAQHGWPSWSYGVRLSSGLARVPLAPWLLEVAVGLHPLAWPVAALGADVALRRDEGRAYRAVGVMSVLGIALFALARGKSYYFAPILPPLLAIGATAIERRGRAEGPAPSGRRLLIAMGVAALLLPMALPVLSIDHFLVYSRLLGQSRFGSFTGETQRLPSHFADELGWPELVEEVAAVYRDLEPSDRARAGIYARNFGEAAAIDVLGKPYGLPSSVSADFQYFFWGPDDPAPEILVVVGLGRQRLERLCETPELARVHRHDLALAPEREVPIWICRSLRRPLPELWPSLRTGT